MQKSILAIVCLALLTLVLSICGLIIAYPVECKNETPTTSAHDLFISKQRPSFASKDEFLKEWGKPVKIIATSQYEETWIYERRLWCGVVPVWFLPAPLLLPVCDGFDRIEFHGNEAKRLHTRRILWAGLVIPLVGASDPDCRYPVGIPPNQGVDANAASPTTQVTTYR